MIKLAMYFKRRTDGRFYKSLYISGNFIFVAFAMAWVIFRLYWYPCKLLYATLYGGVYLGPQDGKFMPLLGVMLILIYGMNVYWFNFIIRMVWRVASTGEDPEDNREYDTTAVSGLDQQKLDLIAAKKTKSRKKKE
ncbi:hypothetical protein WR25_01218 [Diploscapter pachys]|uniref:TLC domain-containing protein n=1 Tax=Diploscapter pachys TaxID=2018661 RepID=A0A2A2KQ16_9BILA|nr:hypothetical protein WR25_01218 [Diploscapter pachys]